MSVNKMFTIVKCRKLYSKPQINADKIKKSNPESRLTAFEPPMDADKTNPTKLHQPQIDADIR
jgi:hypothetical protein